MSLTKPMSRPRAKPKAGYHHGDLESALILEAKRLVAKNGVENISLRQIAVSLGVSPSAAYHYFPDKDALLKAAAKSVFEEMASFQEAQLAQFGQTSALAARRRFRTLGLSYVEYAKRNPNLFRLCFGPYCGGFDMAREESRPWQLLVSCMDDLFSFGEVHPKMRPHAEILAWSAIHGAATLVLDQLIPDEAVESIADSIELALKSPGKVS